MKARSVVDVILGEAKAGSYQDMLAIASVIANRSRGSGDSWQDIVSRESEFNAFGKSLPSGVDKHRDLAEKAIREVEQNGPIHNATFYATPTHTRYLPNGLNQVSATDGHVYFTDPQQRPIYTANGLKPINYDAIETAYSQKPESPESPFDSVLQDTSNIPVPASQNPFTVEKPRGLAALNPSGSHEERLAELAYANQGKIRNKPLTTQLERDLQESAEFVYGPGSKAVIYSGGQDVKGAGNRRTGSTRHDAGKAADVHFYNADGEQLRGDSLAPMAQHWLANNKGGVGLEMRGGGIHLDHHKNRAKNWNYANKKDSGQFTPTQRKAVQAGLRGEQTPMAAAVVPKPIMRSQTNATPMQGGVEQRTNLAPPRTFNAPQRTEQASFERPSRLPRTDTLPIPDIKPYSGSYTQPAAMEAPKKKYNQVPYTLPSSIASPEAPKMNAPAYMGFSSMTPPEIEVEGDVPMPSDIPMLERETPIPADVSGIRRGDRLRSIPRKMGQNLQANLKKQLDPRTLAARGAGALVAGPLGARFGPNVAQFMNRRMGGQSGNMFNRTQNVGPLMPQQTFIGPGANNSQRSQNIIDGNAARGATANFSNGSSRTSLGDGRHIFTSKHGWTKVEGQKNGGQRPADHRSFFSSLFGGN